MTTLIDLLSDLHSRGVVLSLDGDRLRCDAPKGVITPELRAQLGARRQEILAFLSEHPGNHDSRIETQASELPLSHSQHRLWFLDQMDPGNAAYNIVVPLHLVGLLHRDALEDAMRIIVSRHEALRTRFLQRDGVPFAVVDSEQPWDIPFIDLSSLAPSAQDGQIAQLLAEEAQRPYALDKGPLFRVSLYRKGDREHVLLLVMHHIISDGWSIGVLARELGPVYEACVRGLPSPLAPLPVQFRDFVQWEQEHEKHPSSADLDYWRRQLGGELPHLELPTDRPRPAVQTFRGWHIVVDLPPELEERLQQLARRHNVTFFMVLFAAFSVLLRHYTAQEDILVGTPTAGRANSNFECLIGFFVNNLVLRVDLAGDPAFADLLHRVRTTALEAFEHNSIAFDQLVELLQPQRSLDRSPVFQVLFSLLDITVPRVLFAELEMKPFDFEKARARYDLAVDVYPHEDHFRCSFEFNTDIFDEAAIQQLARHYLHILDIVSTDPSQPITKIRLLQESERRQLIEDWNRTAAPLPPHATVPAWFRAQAQATPEALALAMGDRVLTYRQLDAESDRLAAALRSRGVGRGAIVGICLQRSPEMVIGVLGILKTGAAYLPLDPALPPHRIEFLLSDAQVPLILTERSLSGTLSPGAAATLYIDALEDASSQPIPDEGSGDDLAYLIYTSGSTGTPKGTEITHRSLVNLLASMLKEPGLNRHDTLLAVTTLSFDIAGLEVFGPLLCGAKLVLASREQVLDPEILAGLLDSSGATVMQATPSAWRMLVESGWTGRPALRMWCGGEVLPPDLAENLMARGSELWNLYGPTETTIWSAAHRVRHGENPILIGRPIANTCMYILDANLEPVPIGVTGELFIGGEGVARGYWRRPELTATRFLPDPFNPAGLGRVYRTGDLARYRHDGRIQLLGRIDHQIKLRGHRIEPGEIEVAIERHPSVRQAVVVVHGEGAAKQLVAYLRLASESAEADSLRTWLHEHLPEYMVPAVFMPLAEIPLTPNGKVDRKRLPAPHAAPRNLHDHSVPARNGTEQKLAELWSEALHIDRPGVRENFFDLGGHSLLLVQLHARLRREFNTKIAVVDLFRYPTIEALASFLDRPNTAAASAHGADS